MTLIKAPAKAPAKGPSRGHKVFIVSPFTPSRSQIDAIYAQFPGVKVITYTLPWGQPPGDDFPTDYLAEVTVLLTGTYLPRKEQLPKLEFVQLTSAGANHLQKQPLFTETKIPFCTANGVHGPQISEWVITTYLAFTHHLYGYWDLQKQGKWNRFTREHQIDDSYGKRVGILGYGSIGRQTARVAKALGMEVYAHTLHPRDTPESKRDESYSPPGIGDPEGEFPSKWFSGGSKEEIHEFLGSGLDLLVVSTPLTDKTLHLISKPEFEVLSKHKTFVSNIGRGPLIHTDDLIDALEGDLIRGAAIDVTDPEPLPDGHKLWSTKNLFISPHVSGQSSAYLERVLEILKVNLGRLNEGGKLINKVNRKRGY